MLQGVPSAPPPAPPAHGPRQAIDKWPALHEGDGGRFVHAMHVLLERAGCWPGEDDVQWWWFGDSTLAALKAYQVCCWCVSVVCVSVICYHCCYCQCFHRKTFLSCLRAVACFPLLVCRMQQTAAVSTPHPPQSGERLPESGVCDAATWQRLLGPGATPDAINDVWGDNDFDADLGEERRGVFLIGEQRWEDPMKLAKIREKRAKEAGGGWLGRRGSGG